MTSSVSRWRVRVFSLDADSIERDGVLLPEGWEPLGIEPAGSNL